MNGAQQAGTLTSANDAMTTLATQRLAGLLTPGEQVLKIVVQGLAYALLKFQRRSFVAATTNRLIFVQRSLLGGFAMTDLAWQDIANAHISEQLLGATITARTTAGYLVGFGGLQKSHAQALYVQCQTQEQVWREKNRIRQLEAHRPAYARAGLAATATPDDVASRIQKAKSMLEQGLITEADFEGIKAKAIATL